MKTQIFQVKIVLPKDKFLGETFLVLSILAQLRDQLFRVHKVFWHLLCKF